VSHEHPYLSSKWQDCGVLVRPTSQETIDANGGILLWDDMVRHREDAQIRISYYCLDNEPEVRGCPFVESRLKMHLRETEVVPLQGCNGQRRFICEYEGSPLHWI
jgi:hypothetical protein